MAEECEECGSEKTSVIPHAGDVGESKVICFDCETTYFSDTAETTSPDHSTPDTSEPEPKQTSLSDW